jgi:hypothetical protein
MVGRDGVMQPCVESFRKKFMPTVISYSNEAIYVPKLFSKSSIKINIREMMQNQILFTNSRIINIRPPPLEISAFESKS